MNRKILFSACALSAIAGASVSAAPAFAQAAPPPAEQSATAAEEDSAVNTQDIVVTAQGRAQVLADVPIAVSAINAASLERSGANDIRQLAQIAPSLQVSSTGNEANGSSSMM